MVSLSEPEPRASSSPQPLAARPSAMSVTWSGETRNGIKAYTGREWDPETGLYYYRARYYDPKVGRFISEDPIGFDGGEWNFYSYVHEDPVSFKDPSRMVKIWGNWCGPDWTGGRKEQYSQARDRNGYYTDPLDPENAVRKTHDMCYFDCRRAFPCNVKKRKECMKKCDWRLVKTQPRTPPGDSIAAGIYWHSPDPGKNKDCGCKSKYTSWE